MRKDIEKSKFSQDKKTQNEVENPKKMVSMTERLFKEDMKAETHRHNQESLKNYKSFNLEKDL